MEICKYFLIFFSFALEWWTTGGVNKTDRRIAGQFMIVGYKFLLVVLRAELAHHGARLPHLGLTHLAELLLQFLSVVGL